MNTNIIDKDKLAESLNQAMEQLNIQVFDHDYIYRIATNMLIIKNPTTYKIYE